MKRQLDIETLTLASGSHDDYEHMCVMEAVAYIAGEEWSDHPQCVSPVIAEFLRSWNDSLGDDDRQQLKRWIPEIIGTNAGTAVDVDLSWMALDWLIRVQTPAWLRLAGFTGQANILTEMNEVTAETCPSILPVLQAVRKEADAAWTACNAAWDAARAAARAAAEAAARAAARAAAGDVAGDAVGDAVGAAARAAVGAAAVVVVWASAEYAARDALRPTVTELQAGAHDLVGRMVAYAKSHIGETQ